MDREPHLNYANVFTAMAALHISNHAAWNNELMPRLLRRARQVVQLEATHEGRRDTPAHEKRLICVKAGEQAREYFEARMPQMEGADLSATLLSHAFAQVNWTNITETYWETLGED